MIEDHRFRRLVYGLLLTSAIWISAASPAAAGTREFWTSSGYQICVSGITSSERQGLLDINPDTDSEVHQMSDGTWTVCWDLLTFVEMMRLREAVRALSPAPEERWAPSALFSATPSAGTQTHGSYLPIVPTVTRTMTGTPLTVTVHDGSWGTFSNTCSSSSTSCGINDVATLSPGWHTITTTITGYDGAGSSITNAEVVWVWCD